MTVAVPAQKLGSPLSLEFAGPSGGVTPLRAGKRACDAHDPTFSGSGISEGAETSASAGVIPHFTPADALAALSPDFLDEAACRKWVTDRLPLFSGRRLSFRQIYCLAVLLAVGLPHVDIAERLGVNRDTVRHWRDRLAGI